MARQALGLEGANGIGFLQRKPDFIQAIDQTVLAERLDIERKFAAVLRNNDLAFQIDTQFVARTALDFIKQPRNLTPRQHDGQQAVLDAVVEENIGISRRNNGSKTEQRQSPGSVLAAGTATNNQNRK